MLRLADLREMLRYVPHYRDKLFVIAVDGAVVESENFRNLLLDVALLRSLRIGVALVHGAGHQIKKLADQAGVTPSNVDGAGVTDAATLQLAIAAATRVTHEILEGLSATDLRGAATNALVAHPAGILQGVDHLWTGKVERVDVGFLRSLLEHDIIPVIAPLGCDGEGNTYRLNSDAVAVEVAKALQAVKLIYLSTLPGILVKKPLTPDPSPQRGEGKTAPLNPNPSPQGGEGRTVHATGSSGEDGELIRHIGVEDAEAILKKQKNDLAGPSLSKLTCAVKAARGGVPRVHIIDGRVEEGLLAEVFSNEGVGTLVHTNEYQAIRRAFKKDARAIFALAQAGMENDELLPRTQTEIERTASDYYVFEVDGSLAGCAALHQYPEAGKAEMACVCVAAKYENQGIGGRLMQFIEDQARASGFKQLFCLSTQAVNYFVQKGGFQLGAPDDLPPPRRQLYDASGRKSQVLVKRLT